MRVDHLAASTARRTPAVLIALEMTFGMSGDLVLAGVIRTPNLMIRGILVFSIGHFCHITAFAQVADAPGLKDPFAESSLWMVFVVAVRFCGSS